MKLRTILPSLFRRAVSVPVATDETDAQLLDGLAQADRQLHAMGLRCPEVDATALVVTAALEWVDDDTPVSVIKARLIALRAHAPLEIH